MTRNFKPIGEASNWMRLLVLCAGLLAMPLAAQAQEPSRHLQGIEVEQLPGQQVQLRLRMDGTAPQPMAFTIDNPARISLDLPDTGLALDQRRKEVGVGVVNSVVAAEAGEVLRYAPTGRASDGRVDVQRDRPAHRSRRDRHEHIGEGHVGAEAFRLILNDRRFRELPMILETPKGGDTRQDARNLATLRSMLPRTRSSLCSAASMLRWRSSQKETRVPSASDSRPVRRTPSS